jgi:outer membrane receptor protein involved in Fe transport
MPSIRRPASSIAVAAAQRAPRPLRHPIATAVLIALAWSAGSASAQTAAPAGSNPTPATLERVEIVGTAPIPGTGIDRNKVPANVQQFNSARLDELGASNLPELLRNHMGSAQVTETQGNPYQMEVSFRGYTASPLLGQPQGLSVFLDGVRLNEAFGDVVNWDLVPRNALASVTMLPGANPVFGLNTLGGALVLATKSGDSHPGTELELSLGSFGRKDLELSHGRALDENTFLFVATDLFKEDGWREHSPSQVHQLFAKLNHEDGPLDWSLSFNGADNTLIGNGLLPESMLAQSRRQIYTRPDQTRNRLAALNLQAGYDLGGGQRVQALAHVRQLNTDTVNGDLNQDWDGVSALSGVENRTEGRQRTQGVSLQWSRTGADSQLTLGAAHDQSSTEFQQSSALGTLDTSRAVTDVQAEELNAKLSGRSRTSSLYATETLQLSPALALTAAGRYNHTQVTTVDVGRTQGLATALDSNQRYNSLNPSLGATWTAPSGWTVYGNLSQGSRAPSPIELGCSDPVNPCVLPNALQSDPPLKQVVSRSVEAGVRGQLAPGWRWNSSVFMSDNRDDILFVSNSRAAGYFANVGQTRRQGLEMGLTGRTPVYDVGLQFTLLDASYRSGACLVASANSSASTATTPASSACPAEGEIEVRPGDRLPGVPRQLLKLDLGWRAVPGLRLGANLTAQSGSIARGNDNNQQQPDGVDFNGSGHIAGFAVLNLNASWKLGDGWTLSGKVNNALDRHYGSGAQLGQNAYSANGTLQAPADWRNEQFVAPGAPRSYTVALNWRFRD